MVAQVEPVRGGRRILKKVGGLGGRRRKPVEGPPEHAMRLGLVDFVSQCRPNNLGYSDRPSSRKLSQTGYFSLRNSNGNLVCLCHLVSLYLSAYLCAQQRRSSSISLR